MQSKHHPIRARSDVSRRYTAGWRRRRRPSAPEAGRDGSKVPRAELERRLLELGFVEGADVELLHQGLFGGDPIAVRVADATIALRRREAMAIMVAGEEAPP